LLELEADVVSRRAVVGAITLGIPVNNVFRVTFSYWLNL